MIAVHDGGALGFQRFGRGDVGGDHIFFDELVGVQALAGSDGEDAALFIQDDAAFGEVEVERLSAGALGPERAPAGPEGDEGLLD